MFSQDGYAIIWSRYDNEDVAMEILALLFLILGISVIRYVTKARRGQVHAEQHGSNSSSSSREYSLLGGPFISSEPGDTAWHANQAHRLQRFYQDSDR